MTRLEQLREHLDEVAIAGVVDKDGDSFYNHLHKAIEIVEALINEGKTQVTR